MGSHLKCEDVLFQFLQILQKDMAGNLAEPKLSELILQLEECRKLLNGLIKYFEGNLNLK